MTFNWGQCRNTVSKNIFTCAIKIFNEDSKSLCLLKFRFELGYVSYENICFQNVTQQNSVRTRILLS